MTDAQPPSPAPRPPSGTVTFLFTDIEGSTKLAQQFPDQWEAQQERHRVILRSALERHTAHVFNIVGDAFCVAFNNTNDAIKAAIDAQRKLQMEDWGDAKIKVRMGLHTGAAERRENDYRGYLTLALVQRVMSAAHGGQILLSNACADFVRGHCADEILLRDMKENRLKGMLNLERLWQIVVPDLQHEFPALASLNVTPNNLPAQMTGFIGREKEIAAIKQAINEHRLVTLTGSGGVGKTRLSLHVAADLLEEFDYLWFVEFAPIADPATIPQAILSALGLNEQEGKSPHTVIHDYLQDKKTLLILDNCEHLIEASAKISYSLLNHAPALKILASSREALGVKGEMAWHVPSLSVPDINHLPEFDELSQYESIRLFVERAALAKLNFTATKENAAFIAHICSRLDGIPLAIELAAARVKALSVDQITARLDDRFRLLTGGSRTSLPRQQTLRATIDWSYNLLTEPERALLRHLTVFSGGWTLEAAESVCSVPLSLEGRGARGEGSGFDVLDLLTQLVDKSLVNLKDARYRILETTRQYAREKLLDSGEAAALHDKHLNYFLDFVKDAEKELRGPNQPQRLKSLNAMRDNLRAALEWAVESRHTESALKLALRLDQYWHMRSEFTEGRQWLERVLALPDALLDTESYAHALTQLATQTWLQIGAKAAKPAAEQALSIAHDHNDKWNIARALDILGLILTSEENFAASEAALEESKALFQEVGDAWGHAHTVISLGWAAFTQDNRVKALELHEQALMLFRQVGDPYFQCVALYSIGRLHVMQGDVKQGLVSLREALIIAQQMESKYEIAAVLNCYGEAVQLIEKPARAVHFYWAARNLYDSIGAWAEENNPRFENRLAPCRAALGESEFTEAMELGGALTTEQAIELALEENT